MVTELSIYRNDRGELFFRLSPTQGRTGSYRVQAESEHHLERWLAVNGFRPVMQDRAGD